MELLDYNMITLKVQKLLTSFQKDGTIVDCQQKHMTKHTAWHLHQHRTIRKNRANSSRTISLRFRVSLP